MSYQVLARKWRPQRFEEVVGQAHVTGTLRNAIAGKRVAHAYVFVGPRGVGKTSIARIFAKALNCPKSKGPDPCDECDVCREIREGRSLDVIEIDGASNNGVDEVRDLRENALYLPSRGPYKIYIIDEVHMLSISAFNALLKTLEEPPAHVKFFFATTEVQKIPATILSRCQRFDLRRISTPDIANHLGKLAKQEGIEVDADALLAIARGAEGGLRDAESALDQLIAFRGKTINEADVLSVFGLVSRRALDGIAGAILEGDMPALIKQVGELDAAGKDLQRLAFEMLEYFRSLLVAASGATDAATEATEDQLRQYRELAQRTNFARLMAVTDILLDLQSQIRFALSRRTLIELALIRCARAAKAVTLDEVLAQLVKARSGLGAGDAAAAAPAPIPPKPAATQMPPSAPSPPTRPPTPVGDEQAALLADWRTFVSEVRSLAPLASGYLLDAKPVELTADRLVLAFDPEFASNRQKIDVPRNVSAIQRVMEARVGRQLIVEFRVLAPGEASQLPADDAPAAAAPPTTAERTTPAVPAARTGGAKGRQAWMEDPSVKRALETFHGDIIDIRE